MCEGRFFPVHRLTLASCSNYFEQLFTQLETEKHPVIVLTDIKAMHIETLLSYMYSGKVNILQKHLPDVLHIANLLNVKGLSQDSDENTELSHTDTLRTRLEDKLPSSSKKVMDPLTGQIERLGDDEMMARRSLFEDEELHLFPPLPRSRNRMQNSDKTGRVCKQIPSSPKFSIKVRFISVIMPFPAE